MKHFFINIILPIKSSVFSLYFKDFFSYISQINEPRRWVFLCIWYENRCFGIYKIKRLIIPLYMALCMPLHLWQLTSRVYQDHPAFRLES